LVRGTVAVGLPLVRHDETFVRIARVLQGDLEGHAPSWPSS